MSAYSVEGNTVSKKAKLFATLQKKWLTPMDAAIECGVFALSQRCGEFRREGHCVVDKWVRTLGGARVKSYHIVKPTNWTA